jgi:hypothetical protein
MPAMNYFLNINYTNSRRKYKYRFCNITPGKIKVLQNKLGGNIKTAELTQDKI